MENIEEEIKTINRNIEDLYSLINSLNERMDQLHKKFDPNEALKGVKPYPMGEEG